MADGRYGSARYLSPFNRTTHSNKGKGRADAAVWLVGEYREGLTEYGLSESGEHCVCMEGGAFQSGLFSLVNDFLFPSGLMKLLKWLLMYDCTDDNQIMFKLNVP